MTQNELFDAATKIYQNWRHEADTDDHLLLAALETFFWNGLADDLDGDEASITGHFYRVDRWIVITNNMGDQNVLTFTDEAGAQRFFTIRSNRYARYLDAQED